MKKILVVDDNPLNLKLIKTILTVKGFNVIAVENPEAVLGVLDEIEPDLIFLDIQMPKLDGITLLGKIREKFSKDMAPVIALTAYAMRGDKEKFLEAGFDDYIEKPIDIKNFLKKVEDYIENKTKDSDSG